MKKYTSVFIHFSFLCIILLLSNSSLRAQVHPGWKHTIKNSLNTINKACSFEIDGMKNCFVLGTTSVPDSAKDILLIKYTPTGAEEWRRIYDNPDHGDDIPIAMNLDAQGNVLITGLSKDKSGNADILVLKYSSEGIPVVDMRFDGPAHSFDTPGAITSDRFNNIVVTGAETSRDSGLNMVVYRIHPDGGLAWKRNYSSLTMDIGNAILTDDSCNVYITGNCNTAPHSSDILIQKYDSSGKVKWTEIYNGVFAENDAASLMKMDDSTHIYVSGFVNHTSDRSDVPLLKLNRNGEMLREKFYNGGISDCYATNLTINKSGAFLTIFRTDYSTGTNSSMVLYYDKAGIEKKKIVAPTDVIFQNFIESGTTPLILGNKLTHPESTLMPYIAAVDTGSTIRWDFADSTIFGMAHLVKVGMSGDRIYFLGDDAGDATGSIEIMTYTLVADKDRSKKVPLNKSKSGVSKN